MLPETAITMFVPKSVGPYRLYGFLMVPTNKTIDSFTANEAKTLEQNPFIEVCPLKESDQVWGSSPNNLPGRNGSLSENSSFDRPRHVRKLHFQSLGGNLETIFMRDLEANGNRIMLTESAKDYDNVLQKLIYSQIIDLRTVDYRFVFVADRLMLDFMVQAMLFYVEETAVPRPENSMPFLHPRDFLQQYLPLLGRALTTKRFKRHYATRLVDEYEEWHIYTKEREQFFAYQNIENKRDKDPKPVDPWVIFGQCDMLEDIAWKVSNATGHDPLQVLAFVTQMLRIEGTLSDQQLRCVFSQLRWTNPTIQMIFEEPEKWRARVRDIVVELLELAKQERITNEVTEALDFKNFRERILVNYSMTYPCFEGMHRLACLGYTMEVYIPDYGARIQCVSMRVSFFNFIDISAHVLEQMKIKLQIRMIERHCTCRSFQDVNDDVRHEGIVINTTVPLYRALSQGVLVKLQDHNCREAWAATHRDGCYMRFITTITLGKMSATCEV